MTIMEQWPRIVIQEPAPSGAALEQLFAPLWAHGVAVLVLQNEQGRILNEMYVAGHR